MNVIITGFEPFADIRSNPSETVVASLPKRQSKSARSKNGRESKEISITTAILPVCCSDARKALKPLLKQRSRSRSPMIMLGVASGRKSISLERFALNIQDYSVADNGGHTRVGRKIAKRGPDAIATSVNILTLSKTLRRRGFKVEVSNHAGTFLCNEVYYRALNSSRKSRRPTDVLFVHLPLPEVYAKKAGLKGGAADAIAAYKACVLEIVRRLAI